MTYLLQSLPQILTCFLICAVKILEMSIQSVRLILQVKGLKVAASLIAFIECLIWGLVASAVILTLSQNIYWLFAYCLGFASGIFFGSIIEDKLALGKVNLQFMTDEKDGNRIIEYLIANNKGFIAIEGFGYHGKSFKINTVIDRRYEKRVITDIHKITANVFVVTSDIGKTIGGYGLRK